MKRLLFLLLGFAAVEASPSWACLNEYRPNPQAELRSQELVEQLRHHSEKEPWTTRRDRLRQELAGGGDYQVKNDLAVALAHTGEAAEAVSLLEAIEEEHPGLYETASNLGTALELQGETDQALEWISRGLERNPQAHEQTEWLHVRILETKQVLAQEPDWLEKNAVLGPRGQSLHGEQSARGNGGEELSAAQVKAALIYQLHERLELVPPPDPVVADLLMELAELVSEEPAGFAGAQGIVKMAGLYLADLPHVETLRAAGHRWAVMERRMLPPPLWERLVRTVFTSPAFFLFLAALLSFVAICGKRMVQRRWRP